MNIVEQALSFFFPPRCVICKRGGVDICTPCISRFEKSKHGTRDTVALFSYQDEKVKKVLWALKYEGRKNIALPLGPVLYAKAKALTRDEKEVVSIVPVPLFHKKESMRGYNQSFLLAESLVNNSSGEFVFSPKLLQRMRETESQMKLKSKEERIENMKDAFEARDDVSGKIILLIDDVITTGATVHEAKNALMKAGAQKIYTLSVAH